MPVYLNSSTSCGNAEVLSKEHGATPYAERPEISSPTITIGLINNMPDSALEATERQFISLLDAVSDGISVQLSLYSLPGVPRNEVCARRLSHSYAGVESLWGTQLDGLIVTGREPLTSKLSDEPYWESFTQVVDWARDNTSSTAWSCLAAHAAILYTDGISRVRSEHKHCGVFACGRVSDHPLIAGAPSHFQLPHSRWNGVPEDELAAGGYHVLTRTANAGVDTFVKQQKSMFVFFQGHPEYESNTLLLEYRRDILRYLRTETDIYPRIPSRYVDQRTLMALTALHQEARSRPPQELLQKLSIILGSERIVNTWRSTAISIYKNWLQYLCAQKSLRLPANRFAAEPQRKEGAVSTLTQTRRTTPMAVSSQAMHSQGQPQQLRIAR